MPRYGVLSTKRRTMAEREANWAIQPGKDSRTRAKVPNDAPVTRLPTARPDAPVKAPDDAPVTRPPTAHPDAPTLVLALESHIVTLKTDIERLTTELAGERAARQADQERHQEQLVELARRLAEIAEKQTPEPEPPRRSRVGRAWRWFLRN
jgi:hypothetical protein